MKRFVQFLLHLFTSSSPCERNFSTNHMEPRPRLQRSHPITKLTSICHVCPPSIHPSVCLSIHYRCSYSPPFLHLSIYLFLHPSIPLSIYLFTHVSIHLSILLCRVSKVTFNGFVGFCHVPDSDWSQQLRQITLHPL